MVTFPRWQAMLLATVGAALFSSKAIFIKLAYRYGVDAETLITLRMVFSLPFFVGVAWWSASRETAQATLSRKQLVAIGGLGFLGYYLASYLDFLGLQYISAGLERLVLYLYPTIVMLLSALFLKKPFTARGVFALALSYAGIALVFVHDVRLSDPAAVRLGATLVFCSALAYAIYLVGSSETIKRVGSVRFTALAMIVSCLLCVLQFIVLRPVVSLFSQPWQVYGYGAIVAVFCTVIPTFMISEALKHLGANAVSLAGASGPVATLVLGVLLLGEPMGWLQIVGGVLVVAGVLVITLKPMPKLAGPTILPKSALGNR